MNWPPEHCVICGNDHRNPLLEVKDHSISQEVFHLKACSECGFISTVDAPDQADIGVYYDSDDYISHSDTRKNLTSRLYHFSRDFMLSKKRRWIERYVNDTGRLLDIGSGTGYFLNEMKSHGWQVQGIEVNRKAREASIHEFNLKVDPPPFLEEIGAQSMDVITLWHVLEHVHDLNAYWQMFGRLLKKDGVLFIAVPNITSHDAKYYGKGWAALDVPRHLWHFRPEDIKALAEKHQFRVDAMIGMPLDAYYVSILSERYRGSSFALLKGIFRGFMSQMKAGDDHKMSSVVYVLRPD